MSKRDNGRGPKESPAASLVATDEHLCRMVDRAISSEMGILPTWVKPRRNPIGPEKNHLPAGGDPEAHGSPKPPDPEARL